MQTYTWFGINSNGKKISGRDDANSRDQLRVELGKQNIFLLKATPRLTIIFAQKQKIKAKQIVNFIGQLAILINANVPLLTAFNIIGRDEKNLNLKKLIIGCQQSIANGQSLYKTLCQYPKHFNELLCGLINVGEQTGNLDIILNELTNYFTKIALQKSKMIKALFYPMIVLGITFVVMSILLLFVIPQFKTMYNNLGADLPSYTQTIINLADFFQKNWWLIFGGGICIIIGLKIIYQRSLKFRYYLDDLSLKTPLISKILICAIITRLTKTIGLSFKSGMPLLKAIDISVNTIKSYRYQQAMKQTAAAIANGKTFHGSLAEQNLFPTRMIQLIALGEETGKLDLMLEKIAQIYNEELNNIADHLSNLLEPAIMLILGVLVGGLIVGMYLPIFRIGTLI